VVFPEFTRKHKRVALKKNISSLFRLIRFPNLVIICLTQVLLRYCIVRPILFSQAPELISSGLDFYLLVLVTVLLAIGGYIINDYFDIPIDEVNKPGKNMVGDKFSEDKIRLLHQWINGIAIVIGFYLAYRLKSLSFGLVFPFIAFLLWFYSAKYKRTFVLGNLIIAVLSALVIFVVWYFEFLHLRLNPENFVVVLDSMKLTTRFFLLYGLFAFLVSLFREMIKDMEDIKGDQQNGCRTIPVVLGIKTTKYIVALLVVLVIFLVVYCCWIAYNLTQTGILYYLVGVVITPMIYLLVKIFPAKSDEDFHFLSSLCKIIMIAGILTMQLISVIN
jgi:4-hydroxybenzoate polyprenyltransferase